MVDKPNGASETRTRILEATRSCFQRYGSAKTSIQDVANAAGLSRGTIYRYFQDRQILVHEYVEFESQQFMSGAAKRLDEMDTLEEQLAEFAVIQLHASMEVDSIPVGFVIEPRAMVQEMTEGGSAAVRRGIKFFTPYFEAALQRGEVRKDLDIPRAAEWTARMLMTFHTTPSLTVNFEDEDDVRCFVRDHMVRGFRK